MQNLLNFGFSRCCLQHRCDFLKIFPELPPTPLQLEEDLEQLKVLENGYKMKVIKVEHDAHSIDTPEDVAKIENFMCEKTCPNAPFQTFDVSSYDYSTVWYAPLQLGVRTALASRF
ncbi:3-deoxy-manno-octulosonate cytidylyltransferase-like protein [Drosera capensis]